MSVKMTYNLLNDSQVDQKICLFLFPLDNEINQLNDNRAILFLALVFLSKI